MVEKILNLCLCFLDYVAKSRNKTPPPKSTHTPKQKRKFIATHM